MYLYDQTKAKWPNHVFVVSKENKLNVYELHQFQIRTNRGLVSTLNACLHKIIYVFVKDRTFSLLKLLICTLSTHLAYILGLFIQLNKQTNK